MSGFRLRALLEETDLCATLINNNGNNKSDAKSKLQVPNNFTPSSASLLNTNIWDDNDDDFNLEYMDLDEFLTETGLVDTNFASIINSSSASPAPERPTSEQSQTTENPISGIDSLLNSVQPVSSPCSSDSSCLAGPKAQEQPAPSSPEGSSNSTESSTPQKDQPKEKPSVNIVKKRKYKEDGEGLDDTSVVVVPGQDGFDPAHTKFAPEELQPQPIIKKSKKQFVPEENKDEKYWRRRNKNNVAAKRSREARRAKENQIIMRAGFLEDENEQLRSENKDLKKENEDLKNLVRKLKLQAK